MPELAVYKYPIVLNTQNDVFNMYMPKNAKILCIQVQHGNPQIWALVNLQEEDNELRHFRIAGTGHSILHNIKVYIGTFQLFDGDIIFHLFEIEKP